MQESFILMHPKGVQNDQLGARNKPCPGVQESKLSFSFLWNISA